MLSLSFAVKRLLHRAHELPGDGIRGRDHARGAAVQSAIRSGQTGRKQRPDCLAEVERLHVVHLGVAGTCLQPEVVAGPAHSEAGMLGTR